MTELYITKGVRRGAEFLLVLRETRLWILYQTNQNQRRPNETNETNRDLIKLM